MCLACEDVLLGYGWVCFFIVVSVVKTLLCVLMQQLLCGSGSVYGMRRCSDFYGYVGVFIVIFL